MVLPKGPTRPGQPKKQELTVLDVAPVAGQTTGEAAYAVVLGDKETWLGTKLDGSPTDYSMGKIETRLNARENLTVGGAVDSVNGETGAVVLDADDIDAVQARSALLPATGRADHPTLVEARETAMLHIDDQTAPTIMWPCLVDMRLSGGSGVMLVYSTDHASTAGDDDGIYAATATDPLATFTATGRIYNDNTAGNQTESPSVVWVEEESLYYLYYHNNAVSPGAQSTLLATSPDMATFTRVGVIDNQWASGLPGDGHDGYFRPFRHGGGWYGVSIYGGGTPTQRCAYRRSLDGIDWYWHGGFMGEFQFLSSHIDGVTPNTVMWPGSPFRWQGEMWLPFVIKRDSDDDRRVLVAPWSMDTGRITAPAIDITPDDPSPATNLWLGPVSMWDGHLYMGYRGSNSVDGKAELRLWEVV